MVSFIMRVLLPLLGGLYFMAVSFLTLVFEPTIGGIILLVVALWNLYELRRTRKYDGDLVVEHVNEYRALYSFELDDEAGRLAEKDEVCFKVRHV